jgi:ABC-type dipeptide/oligopeptide/nickel transport system permease subunit
VNVGAAAEKLAMRVTDLFFVFPPLILAMSITAALGIAAFNAIIAGMVVLVGQDMRG